MTKICLIAGNLHEAETYARSQDWEPSQWFYPKDLNDLMFKSNFHVLVVGSAGMNTPSSFFEKIYSTAVTRGRMNRI